MAVKMAMRERSSSLQPEPGMPLGSGAGPSTSAADSARPTTVPTAEPPVRGALAAVGALSAHAASAAGEAVFAALGITAMQRAHAGGGGTIEPSSKAVVTMIERKVRE